MPTCYREEVLNPAHSVQFGSSSWCQEDTEENPQGLLLARSQSNVKRYCQACECCQRGAKSKAPLMPLPVVEEPFRRVAIDIVGPLRKTKRRHKYILTVMDFATRFPEAIPLRRIDASSVADALLAVFTRLGFPDEILSDQGSNFMSKLMKHVLELLHIHLLHTTHKLTVCWNGFTIRSS